MENTICIQGEKKEPVLLPMGGRDSQGNQYEVDNIGFIKNGKRFLPVMGEFHFSRYEPEGWEEGLQKMKAGGVNITAAYVFWNHHEEREGEWDFTGSRNLKEFLQICKKVDMPLWLRIGPWAHGECRNGGFPDWLIQDEAPVRVNAPLYLARVERFWARLGEQAEGMMCKDGGPVIGIQLENEYGHCGGPSEKSEGMAHMKTLKKMAIEAGLDVPYYTATGWGGAYVVDGEMLPVLGGYVDAPWAEHVQEMPASDNFVFSSYKQDENIGSDLKQKKDEEFTFDTRRSPYLTAELGGGLQVTSHRRTYPWPKDIESQALCMLGSGANLLGYYMYHGGINPEGKYTTLQESRATGYNNDLPVKSYDFQTCIRESGELGESFGKLKKLHLFLSSFGEILAGADTYFADIQPESAEDMHTMRVSARVNQEKGTGFLFINNHQRKRRMDAHSDCSIRLTGQEGELILPHITVRDGDTAVLPFTLPGSRRTEEAGEGWDAAALLPEKTNASLLCRVGSRVFFYSDLEQVYFEKPEQSNYIVLSESLADRAFMIKDKLYLTEYQNSCLVETQDGLYLLTKAYKETLLVYEETGEAKQLAMTAEPVQAAAKAEFISEEKAQDGTAAYREYQVKIDEIPQGAHKLYLEVDYEGDRAELYLDGKLAADWFTNGEKWHILLNRYGCPQKLMVRIYPSDKPMPNPYDNQVYYDLPVKAGCGLHGVKILPEYKLAVK